LHVDHLRAYIASVNSLTVQHCAIVDERDAVFDELSVVPEMTPQSTVDYRYLNKYTVGEMVPMPVVDEMIHRIGRGSYITTPRIGRLVHEPDHLRVSSGWTNSSCDF